MALTKIRGNTQIMNETITDDQIALNAQIKTSKLKDGAEFIKRDGSVQFTGNVNLGMNRITNVAPAINPNDVVTKQQLDTFIQGLDIKESCYLLADFHVDIQTGGEIFIDGVLANDGSRVLLINQNNKKDNGIYVVNSDGPWSRAFDFDENAEIEGATFTFIEAGNKYKNSGWVLVTKSPQIGVTELIFTKFTGVSDITAGKGLIRNGETLDIGQGRGIIVNDDDITLKIKNSTLSLDDNGLAVATEGITSNELANNAVTREKIHDNVAGLGLIKDADGALAVSVDNSTLEISGDNVRIKDRGVTLTKLQSSQSSAQIILTDLLGNPKYTSISGDIAIDVNGVATVSSSFMKYNRMIWNETPTPAPNGVNTTFTLSYEIRNFSAIMVFVNGILQEQGLTNDYTIGDDNKSIVFTTAPASTDKIKVAYLAADTVS